MLWLKLIHDNKRWPKHLWLQGGFRVSMNMIQNGCHLRDGIFKHIFLNENVSILIKILLKFVPNGPINNIPALLQNMAWCRQAESHYLNQCGLHYWFMYAAICLNELILQRKAYNLEKVLLSHQLWITFMCIHDMIFCWDNFHTSVCGISLIILWWCYQVALIFHHLFGRMTYCQHKN